MFVKFTESRRIRHRNVTTKFCADGTVYPFDETVHQQFVDIGHAKLCQEDGSPLVASEVGEKGPEIELPGKRGPGRPRSVPLNDADRPISVADVPEPKRDFVRNGGMTED